ncbi:MAG: cytochrome b/b6 domain-containing protein [Sphingomonas sp.]|nr:cytochrome b/b6 domain-containing protein [Sphingomonas sp.]
MKRVVHIPIWDLPTRIFHWSIVPLIPFLWWSAQEGRMDLHIPAGIAMLGLLVFRLLWGVTGGSTARFAGFIKGPRALRDQIAGRGAPSAGHSPLGALSVIAMLAVLAAQVGLGLFAVDEDGLASGPLAHFVSYDASERLTELHHDLFDVLLVLIALHVAAILFYLIVRRRNLVRAMLLGKGDAPADAVPMRPAPVWRFWAAAAVAAAVAIQTGMLT